MGAESTKCVKAGAAAKLRGVVAQYGAHNTRKVCVGGYSQQLGPVNGKDPPHPSCLSFLHNLIRKGAKQNWGRGFGISSDPSRPG